MVQKLKFNAFGKTIIGLTGSFGSGKSTVAHFFEELGAFIVDADKIAHEALMVGSRPYEKISRFFSDAFLPEGQGMDLKKLADIIFEDAKRKQELEAIIHPYVFTRIMEEIIDAEEQVVIVDIPLLFESGYDRFCYETIAVEASEDVINQRLQEKGFSLEEIQARNKAQWPLNEKVKKAGIIINNSETFQKTRKEVERVWKQLHDNLKGA